MGEPMRTISLKVPAELDEALTELAKRHHRTRSAVLREALELLAHREPSSVRDLSLDLAGCASGPEDLATHPKHMKGYGR